MKVEGYRPPLEEPDFGRRVEQTIAQMDSRRGEIDRGGAGERRWPERLRRRALVDEDHQSARIHRVHLGEDRLAIFGEPGGCHHRRP